MQTETEVIRLTDIVKGREMEVREKTVEMEKDDRKTGEAQQW